MCKLESSNNGLKVPAGIVFPVIAAAQHRVINTLPEIPTGSTPAIAPLLDHSLNMKRCPYVFMFYLLCVYVLYGTSFNKTVVCENL